MEDTGFSGFSGVSGIRTLALRFTQPSMATRLTYAKINLECFAMQRSVFAMTVLMGAVSWGGCAQTLKPGLRQGHSRMRRHLPRRRNWRAWASRR
jgi:hypothetical protein